MKEILLSGGHVALVDDGDYERLVQYRWTTIMLERNTSYARATVDGSPVMMHRLIIDPLPGLMVDHINGNGLDNRRGNLRIATQQGNSANCVKRSHNKSGYKGVAKDTSSRRKRQWRAQITVDGKVIRLGRFDDPAEAAKVYDAAALQYFGEFARLNFPAV